MGFRGWRNGQKAGVAIKKEGLNSQRAGPAQKHYNEEGHWQARAGNHATSAKRCFFFFLTDGQGQGI